MPTYRFKCPCCLAVFEQTCAYEARDTQRCPQCGEMVEYLFTAADKQVVIPDSFKADKGAK